MNNIRRNKSLLAIHYELSGICEREAINLWRIARDCQRRGLDKLAQDIRAEGTALWDIKDAYPERILDWKFKHETRYAFRFSTLTVFE